MKGLIAAWAVAFASFATTSAEAYSVLAHQAVIDATWEKSLAPALRSRFPVNAEELKAARAFAYGGCLIQDLGYYPFSSRFFGDLTHYVRSGDFVEALLRQATSAPEFAFALGALAHHAADTEGHSIAVNRAVPMIYPELRAKFGDEVTYHQHPAAHLKTEFGFDVLQVARGHYAPAAYHDFIGFEVANELLARAFRSTYGLELDDVFGNLGFAITTFRWTVTTTIPEMTKVAWESNRKEIDALSPGGTREQFVFTSTRAEFERRWGRNYKRPNFAHRLLAWVLRVVPRFGPFKPLAYRPPTPEAQRLFLESFAATIDRYRELVATARSGPIENRNLDTGRDVTLAGYRPVDDTYAELLERLEKQKFAGVDAALKSHLLAFYTGRPHPSHVSAKRWRKTLALVERLKAATSTPKIQRPTSNF